MLESTSPFLALPLMTLSVVAGIMIIERTQVAVRVIRRRIDQRSNLRR